MSVAPAPAVSIVIPVFNKSGFTRQCLDRIARHTTDVAFEVIVIDNASTDDTPAVIGSPGAWSFPLRYERQEQNLGFSRANNLGAGLARHPFLLFLNNDTLATPRWLSAMVRLATSDPAIGIVGIKQLFPYTRRIHHTGIVFTTGGLPQHLYPHADATLPSVNKQRDYQAVTGSCLLIGADLFEQCGRFDEGYINGYEDVDLCLAVRERGRRVVCCTSSFIYHYGQITETRTADDDRNAAYFLKRWAGRLRVDASDYASADGLEAPPSPPAAPALISRLSDQVYFADDLSVGTALSWMNVELALALRAEGVSVRLRQARLPDSVSPEAREALAPLMVPVAPVGGVQVKWSHYWPQHLDLDLNGSLNLEFFVVNYRFANPGRDPWDYWLTCVRGNGSHKLPLSAFCRDVLLQVGVEPSACHVLHPGYAPQIPHVAAPRRTDRRFRFLTVTNSHDLERYGTPLLLDAWRRAFGDRADVVLVVKDYGAAAGDTSLRDAIRREGGAPIEYHSDFTGKERLIELYRSCDAFVSAHRAEGFGMKILDALACGLPVVTPLFGGPVDFCTPSNSVPVAFSLIPMGDCLDTRSLRITNGPTWCEVDVDDLARQLRWTSAHPQEARALGRQAATDVSEAFSWTSSARTFRETIESIRRGTRAPRPVPAAAPPPPTERSPYWLGLRVSVALPTFNRLAQLQQCLAALERQTVLPQEFEVIIVDDGSTDGTGEWVRQYHPPYALQYLSQPNQGPGAARNAAIAAARGEVVLFVGDDIYADPQLLEEHLLAHAEDTDPALAILGHIDWAESLPVNAVMRYASGESSRQFAYAHIPTLERLDYRFFYTSNISLKREFLVDAADAGIRFDPAFRLAAYEDSEFAFRLARLGLRIEYRPAARVAHDHYMDLDVFARRERGVGRMAVVFYQKHPQLDDVARVRWIGDMTSAVDELLTRPALLERVLVFDSSSDALFRAMARSLEDLLGVYDEVAATALSTALPRERVQRRLDGVLDLIFETERTRGKVTEYYGEVSDPAKRAGGEALLATLGKLEFVGSDEVAALRSTIQWLDTDVVAGLRSRVSELEAQLGAHMVPRQWSWRRRLKHYVWKMMAAPTSPLPLRSLDQYARSTMARREWFGLLARYGQLRKRARRMVS